MYPSSNQPTTSFCNYNHENHSKPSQDHFLQLYNYPHYIPLGDEEPMSRELFEQPISNHNSYHEAGVVAHEYSTRKTTANVQPTMENSNYNNGKFGTVDGENRFNNSHSMILENSGLMGNKRSSKKDRHSKINTGRGPRDRRMRLSLDVAKKFFRLQDMLGFDKASNTIEWLLMKSKHAIQDLLPHQQLNPSSSLMGGSSNSASSASECEVLSAGFDDQSIAITDKGKSASCSSNKEKRRLGRKSAHIHHSLAKETREKARARARKRTTEKINNNNQLGRVGCDQYSKFKPSLDQIMDQNVNRLGSCITFRENEVQTNQPQNPISSRFPLLNKQGVVSYNASAIPGSWSPSSFFNYQHIPLPSNVVILNFQLTYISQLVCCSLVLLASRGWNKLLLLTRGDPTLVFLA